MNGTKESCTCGECQQACRNKPGWMSPEQFIKIVEYLGMTPKEAFDKYFAVDWWESFYEELEGVNERRAFLIAPAVRGSEGGYYPFNPNGECVFFSNGHCDIHPVKPEECANMIHGLSESEFERVRNGRRLYAASWQTEEGKSMVKELLGEEPEAEAPNSVFDAISMVSSLFG